eukprot:m.592753 g.592753  ORF g.592753 m.592753 type:complete len:105 (-) comp22391_c0_seq26:1490-1804(-)
MQHRQAQTLHTHTFVDLDVCNSVYEGLTFVGHCCRHVTVDGPTAFPATEAVEFSLRLSPLQGAYGGRRDGAGSLRQNQRVCLWCGPRARSTRRKPNQSFLVNHF